jgi:HAD superfamily hydrolase (TIGR01509 family)
MVISALALDFDGVLADTQDYHARAWRAVLAPQSLHIPHLSRAILGVSPAQFLASLGLPESQQAELIRAKEQVLLDLAATNPPSLLKSVQITLSSLRESYVLAIVTSGERAFVEYVLRHHVISSLFAAVIAGSDVLRPKPAPDPYLACVKTLCLPARAIAAVEDTSPGIASAKEAGLIVVGITNSVAGTFLAGADVIINNFSELPKALSALVVRAPYTISL